MAQQLEVTYTRSSIDDCRASVGRHRFSGCNCLPRLLCRPDNERHVVMAEQRESPRDPREVEEGCYRRPTQSPPAAARIATVAPGRGNATGQYRPPARQQRQKARSGGLKAGFRGMSSRKRQDCQAPRFHEYIWHRSTR